MKNQILLCLFFLFCLQVVFGQFQDNFSDGNLSINPVWSGTTSKFIVNGTNVLQSNGNATAADTLYLTTPSTIIDSAAWEFYLHLGFNPTATGNYVKIYLVANQADLTAPLNGYYLRIGETGGSDTLELWRQDGATDTRILTGNTSFGSITDATVKVTRDPLGNWAFFTDHSAGSNLTLEGSVLDNTYTTTSFFGIYCKYSTASRFNQYSFDNFNVSTLVGDTTKPVVDSVIVQNATNLSVYFSENVDITTGITLTNYVTANTQENPTTAVIDIADSSLVHLTFLTPFLNGQNDTLSVSLVKDRANNTITTTVTPFFYFTAVAPSFKDIVFNEIFADPSPQIALPTTEFIEIYNASSAIYDLSGWQLVNTTTAKTFSPLLLYPNSFLILCSINDTAAYNTYGNVVGFTSWTALSNGGDSLTLVDNLGNVIDFVSYNSSWYNDPTKNSGGWSLELINPFISCGASTSNWSASINLNGGTPGAENSIYSIAPDNIAPDLQSLTIVNDSVIQLFFNEAMDSASLALGNYSFTGGLSLGSVQSITADLQSVTLVFTTVIDTGIFYTATVNNVTDCQGNTISGNNSLSFVIGFNPQMGDVVINEIFADPTPAVSLPEKEFVELFNTTTKLIDLSAILFDGASLPSNSVIQPNGYLILCSINDTGLFSGFGDVVGITFPALTNAGELINLVDAQGNIIDQVTYSSTWYNDPTKDGGGWSLEKKNPIAICNNSGNWSAANNFLGGTPGNQNSIYDPTPDQNLPTISNIIVTGAQSVKLVFNEPMDSLSLINGNYVLSGGITVLSATTLGTPFDSVFLFFNTPIDTGITYTITVSNVSDCPGNTIGTPNSIDFILAPTPVFGDIIINEIFADPSPIIGLPAVEFIELFNTTNRIINLAGSAYDGVSLPANSFIAPKDYVILCEDIDTALFTPYGTVIGLSSWPSLTNGGESIQITNPSGDRVDQITYSSAWYADAEKDNGGWSLEKKNPFSVCNFNNNWQASTNVVGGTPGTQNSVYSLAPDNISPQLIKVIVNSATKIVAIFNEGMDLTSLITGNYSINNAINIDSIKIDSTNYYSVTLFLSPVNTGTIYTLSVNNVTDCPGNNIGNNTANFVLPENGQPNDLIINEILFNPNSGGSDFVEVYNNSSRYIDISTWSLATYNFDLDSVDKVKLIGGEQRIIYPQEYILITKDTANTLLIYPLSKSKTFIEVSSLPTYSNDQGVVVLLSQDNEISDRFDYNADMHFPLLVDDKGVSLERLDFNRTTNDYTNWHSAAENIGFATPGYENSQYQPANNASNLISASPEIFSPDQDGYNDVLNISYQIDGPGYVGSLLIYDAKGRLIRQLMNNELLSPKGVISWDGTNDLNEKSRIGIYIIFFSAYNTNGDIVKGKTTCVLASQL